MKTDEFPADPLSKLERRIAQRADELARSSGADRDHALACWLQAEREILGSFDTLSATPPVAKTPD